VQKVTPKTLMQGNQAGRTLVSYREVDAIFDAIFGACLLDGTTSREKTIYINEAAEATTQRC